MTGLCAANSQFHRSFSFTRDTGRPWPIHSTPRFRVRTARTQRQLRCVRALFRINDPELEQALALIIERLAASQPAGSVPSPDGWQPDPPPE
jgi:hypothetical protein